MEFSDDQLMRYARQILVDGVDVSGQQALLEARVMVVGLGGLGCPAAIYLAGAGIGTLVLNDIDTVTDSNLPRQILYDEAQIGARKTNAAAQSIARRCRECSVEVIDGELNDMALREAIAAVDVVLDCCDNAASRQRINAAAFATARPVVSAAAIRWEGQLSVFDPRRDDSPCYRCLYPQSFDAEDSCSSAGIIGPVVGALGTLQALETIKLLTGAGEPMVGRLWLFDGRSFESQVVHLPRRANCPVCRER
ncbi:molybdopterin-synthase adenylyltransferase MoeB [Gammaproteobacteria bacterium]|nr:molybdopterin-synthase adenylyltransferase MoeB [Gammaproteobacteria bacterium]